MAHNITVTEDGLCFPGHCEACCACLHNCPRHAVHLPKETVTMQFRNGRVTFAVIRSMNNRLKEEDKMSMLELIRTRKSVRTFDGRPLAEEDRKALADYAATIVNPYDIPVKFVFLDADKYGLSSPVITLA